MRISDWSSDVCSSDLTEGAAEVDAHAIIEGFRIADRKRRTPILEAHARSQATIAAGAGASHGHLHRGRGHRPLAADAIIGAIEAILHLFTDLAQALPPARDPLVGLAIGRLPLPFTPGCGL